MFIRHCLALRVGLLIKLRVFIAVALCMHVSVVECFSMRIFNSFVHAIIICDAKWQLIRVTVCHDFALCFRIDIELNLNNSIVFHVRICHIERVSMRLDHSVGHCIPVGNGMRERNGIIIWHDVEVGLYKLYGVTIGLGHANLIILFVGFILDISHNIFFCLFVAKHIGMSFVVSVNHSIRFDLWECELNSLHIRISLPNRVGLLYSHDYYIAHDHVLRFFLAENICVSFLNGFNHGIHDSFIVCQCDCHEFGLWYAVHVRLFHRNGVKISHGYFLRLDNSKRVGKPYLYGLYDADRYPVPVAVPDRNFHCIRMRIVKRMLFNLCNSFHVAENFKIGLCDAVRERLHVDECLADAVSQLLPHSVNVSFRVRISAPFPVSLGIRDLFGFPAALPVPFGI